ncbi:hypothetical protein BDQ17DRAFT_1435374 [Cyathus striatus]|nr:hypothetical protein BDQ17DRAFT_1435374 [Cyathus striatus]
MSKSAPKGSSPCPASPPPPDPTPSCSTTASAAKASQWLNLEHKMLKAYKSSNFMPLQGMNGSCDASLRRHGSDMPEENQEIESEVRRINMEPEASSVLRTELATPQ